MTEIQTRHDVFQAVADPTRRKMIRILADTEQSIAVITEQFPITRTAVNKHLHILSDAGLVTRRKIGRETRYKLDPDPLLELKKWLAYFDSYWDDKLLSLKQFVEDDEK